MHFRLLTAEHVSALVAIDELIDAMADALRRFSTGEIVQPVRAVLPVGGSAFFGVMPALVPQAGAIGAKLVTVFASNRERGLPTHLAVICLFSPHTGALVALIDGRQVTEDRTAAVSAVSATALARDDSAVLAIVGSGAQARSHLRALEQAFELSEVRVWSPTPERQRSFLDEMANTTRAKLIGSNSAQEAVHGADLVVLATSASEPVVQNEWIRSGTHVMSVGACRPHQREMDPALVRRSRFFVDSREAALAESGDVVLGLKEGAFGATHIAGELGELLAKKIDGRRTSADVTVFKSLGLAVEDVVAADLVYRRAVERNVGLEVQL